MGKPRMLLSSCCREPAKADAGTTNNIRFQGRQPRMVLGVPTRYQVFSNLSRRTRIKRQRVCDGLIGAGSSSAQLRNTPPWIGAQRSVLGGTVARRITAHGSDLLIVSKLRIRFLLSGHISDTSYLGDGP